MIQTTQQHKAVNKIPLLAIHLKTLRSTSTSLVPIQDKTSPSKIGKHNFTLEYKFLFSHCCSLHQTAYGSVKNCISEMNSRKLVYVSK